MLLSTAVSVQSLSRCLCKNGQCATELGSVTVHRLHLRQDAVVKRHLSSASIQLSMALQSVFTSALCPSLSLMRPLRHVPLHCTSVTPVYHKKSVDWPGQKELCVIKKHAVLNKTMPAELSMAQSQCTVCTCAIKRPSNMMAFSEWFCDGSS